MEPKSYYFFHPINKFLYIPYDYDRIAVKFVEEG